MKKTKKEKGRDDHLSNKTGKWRSDIKNNNGTKKSDIKPLRFFGIILCCIHLYSCNFHPEMIFYQLNKSHTAIVIFT